MNSSNNKEILCCYCQTNPGTKKYNDNIWNGFLDKDTGQSVCWDCRDKHYQEKSKTEHAGQYSEIPIELSIIDSWHTYLLEKIKNLDATKGYKKIERLRISLFSKNATFLTCSFTDSEYDGWVPNSMLKKDSESNVYISTWFLQNFNRKKQNV